MTLMHSRHATGSRTLPPPPAKQCAYCGSDYTMGSEGRRRYAQRRYCSRQCVKSADVAAGPGNTKRATLPVVRAAVTDPQWRDRAACRDEDPELFFAPSQSDQDRRDRDTARAICHRCPVLADCLTWARAAEVDGIWGGTTHAERTTVRAS